jgi:hypothetical protein
LDSERARQTVRAALSSYRPRNDRLVDLWSFVHLVTCAAMALVVGPALSFLIALAWEPLEVLVLSPHLAKRGIDFGHESLPNSLSDVAFNTVGVVVGATILALSGWTAPLSPF